MGKKETKAAAGQGSGSHVLVVGFVLWFVAWFVPVYKGQEMIDSLAALGRSEEHGVQAPDWLPGWRACSASWQLLVGDFPGAGSTDRPNHGNRTRQVLLGATCLTNAFMLLAMFVAVQRRQNVLTGVCLLGCAALNAGWIYQDLDQNPFEFLRAGYFLWLGSFFLAGVGSLMSMQRPR